MVNLKDWLRLVEIDGDLEEIKIPDERPNYQFRNRKKEEITLAYYFGYIVPRGEISSKTEELMKEYAEHLNEQELRMN